MVDVTLLALHFDDASFTANAPFTGRDEETTARSHEETGESDDRGGTDGKLVSIVGLALSLAVAWAVLRRRSAAGIDLDEEIEVLG